MQAITIPPSLGVRGLKINFNVRFKSINNYPDKFVFRLPMTTFVMLHDGILGDVANLIMAL
jgi:hypothetical protein